MLMDGFTRTEIQTSGRAHRGGAWRQGPAAPAPARQPVHAPLLAQVRAAARAGVHRGGDGSPRLRRQREAAEPAGSRELFVPRDGAGQRRGDGVARLRQVLRRRARPRRARRTSHVPRSSRQGAARFDPRHHPAAPSVQSSDAGLGDRRLSLVLHDPEGADARAADERRPGFLHRVQAVQDKQGLSFFGKEALEEYKRCFRNPETVRGMCEDYRACATIDLAMDTEDFKAGKKITCPVQLLWGATGQVGRAERSAGDLEALRDRHPRRAGAPCGHYLSEEAPEETYRAMRAFFAS